MLHALWAGCHLAAQSWRRIRQVDGDSIFLFRCVFSLQTVSKEKHTVRKDATKLLCQDSCPTLLHTQSSRRGVNLPQTHDFVTEVVFCSTSAVGRGKLIRESASRLLNKKALSSSRQQRYLAKKTFSFGNHNGHIGMPPFPFVFVKPSAELQH